MFYELISNRSLIYIYISKLQRLILECFLQQLFK